VQAAEAPPEDVTGGTSVAQPNGLARSDVVIAPHGTAHALALVVSGDGGWHETERALARELADHGVAVIGINSLKYFWAKKEPRQVAADLARLLTGYGRTFGTRRYLLVGYSFGADIMPDVWPLLPKRVQDRVAVVSLLAPSRFADFEVTIATILGIPSVGSWPAAIHRLPLERTQCFYGREEANRSACTRPAMARAQVKPMRGGHDLDGDVAAIAAAILDAALSKAGDR
jgi:type IV secretory pathway VirJ component